MPKWRAISEVAVEGFSDVTLGMRSYEEMTDGGIPIAEPEPEPTEDWNARHRRRDHARRAGRNRRSTQGEGRGHRQDSSPLARPCWRDRTRSEHRGRRSRPRRPQTADEGAPPADVEAPQSPPSTPAPSPAPTEMTQEEYEAAEAARFDAEQGATVADIIDGGTGELRLSPAEQSVRGMLDIPSGIYGPTLARQRSTSASRISPT